ncbi:hypothetical protein [Mucilaginibacter koreensis]
MKEGPAQWFLLSPGGRMITLFAAMLLTGGIYSLIILYDLNSR